MTKQKILFFLLAMLLLPSVVFADSTSTPIIATSTAQDLTSTTTASTSSGSSTQGSVLGLQAPAVPAIIAEINNAKILLAGINLNHALAAVYTTTKNKKTGKTSQVISKYNLTDKDIALAILDPSNGNVIITVGRQNGTTMVFPDPAFDVKLANFNGVNSRFQINNPPNGTVLALKYLISPTESGSKTAIEKSLYPAVYVPFSQNLNTPEVVAYGKNYLTGVINTVANQLDGLPSAAIPGQTITQAVPPAMIKALVYAEHSETASIMNGNAQGSLDQMNILLAVNGPDTYKYSVSNDGFSSRGIAQFVKSTYDSLVKRHPEAELNKDYVLAMEDHVTSVKAMYLLLDDYAGDVRVRAPDGFLISRVFDYGAASYNAGTSRVAKAVENFGDSWNQDRSGQISSLQNQVTSYNSQVTSLKAKIKKTSDKKTKASLQSQLATAQNNLTSSTNQLATLQAASLKNATVNYLAKIYKVIQYFNDQQLAMK